MPDGREAVELDGRLPLSEVIAKWFTQKPALEPTTGKDRSSDDSSSRLTTSTPNYSFPEEGSGTNESFSGDGSGEDDDFTEDGSGLPTLTPGDDFSEVTSPSPVTTTEDFSFAEPASTTVANDKASEKIGSAGQDIPRVEIIVVPICAVIMLVIVIFVIKIYCLPGKADQEIYSAEEPLVTLGKIITK